MYKSKDYLQFQVPTGGLGDVSHAVRGGLLYIVWGFVFIQKEWAFKYSLFYALHLYHILWMIFHVTACLCMNIYIHTHIYVYCTYRVCSSVVLAPLSQMTAEAPLLLQFLFRGPSTDRLGTQQPERFFKNVKRKASVLKVD